MRYQIFVRSQDEHHFIASIVGMPNLTVEGTTEAEAILNAKSALEAQLKRGKFVSIEVNSEVEKSENLPQMKYAGILADDPTFDDFMDKLGLIRQESNALTDE
ncbi:MAG: type II toxin-antitoxin system HicB family antitoxin [Desmonostoc vinosum HA7617-LM4]|nr:type II toxin-antitoxin system HicB family antitoxin [Desmonostoc vinosum HA7617-LM4]